MKVLVVASTFPAHEKDKAPAFVREQIIHMKKQNPSLDFHVLAPHYSNETDKFSATDYFKEHRFSYFWPSKYQKLAGRGIVPAIESNKFFYLQVPFLFFFEFFALLRLVRKIQPDIIYAHWFTPQGIVASIVSSFTKRPWVLTSHASDVEIWKKIPFGGMIVRRFLPRATAVTAVSQRTLERMKIFFSDSQWEDKLSSKVEIIPMGVDTSKFSAPRKSREDLKAEYGLTGKKTILFIGRLARIKGIEYLIQAFEKASQKDSDLHLVIAGDGPLREELQQLTTELNLNDTVEFTGYISGTPKEDYFHLADIVAVTSIIAEDGSREGLPVVIMEALAAGKICIATDASGADVIIEDSVNGYIVPEKDVDALAKSIQAIANLDQDHLDVIKQAAQTSSIELDWGTVADQHIYHLLKERS